MVKYLAAPRTTEKMPYRVGLSGLLQLLDTRGNRQIVPKNDGVTPDGFEYCKGGNYVAMTDIVQQAGYKNRHIFSNKGLIIDAAGIMRPPAGKEIPPKPEKKKPDPLKPDPVKRENPLKVMNASKMKALIAAAVNTFRHRFTYMPMHFFTVSFPPCIDVPTAKKYLNIWLTRLRKDEKIFMYLWVLEFQKNGTPHFHILIPGVLNVRYANRLMKSTLITGIKQKKINWTLAAAEKYNGVDIQKNKYTRKATNFAEPAAGAALAKYLAKYITKNNEPSEFQKWHCSREWSSLCTGVALTANEAKKFLQRVDHDETIENEFFIFYRWKNGETAPESLQKYLAGINYAFMNHFFIINGNQVRMRQAPDPQKN
jgi:hypothetical protein